MKISRMNKYNKGKLRAFFDLELDMGITIKGFKLMEGINGLFASMPSQEKNGEYYDTIFCQKDVKGEINKIALEHYGQDEPVMETSKQDDDIPF
tara:strand:- start:963 stop:1244 length:282 start_codon:yes stop_codon:yes gene_type:complete